MFTLLGNNIEHFTKKKCSRTLHAGTGEDDNNLHINSPISTPKPVNGNCSSTKANRTEYQCNPALHVSWTLEDVRRIAREIYNGTVADAHLSLFAYWIQMKSENYILAKEHIRELSLDQGYNIDRVENIKLRKLLQDTRNVRARYKHKTLPQILGDMRDICLTDVDADPREPQFAKTVKLQVKATASSFKSAKSNGSIASTPNTKLDILSPSFGSNTEHHSRVAESSSVAHPSKYIEEYPPNTPDRPAPLVIRSCSVANSATQISKNLPRSVSSPIHDRSIDMPPLLLPRISTLIQNMESHPLLLPSPTASFAASGETDTEVSIGTDDIFGIPSSLDFRYNKLSKATRTLSESVYDSTRKRNAFTEPCDQHCVGPFELDAVDIESNSSYDSDELFVLSHSKLIGENRSSEHMDFSNDLAFEATQIYAGSSDNISILESASSESSHESQAKYSYAPKSSHLSPVVIAPVPTYSERKAASQIHNKNHSPDLMVDVPSSHRPLPLRSYENAAYLQQKHYTQYYLGQSQKNSIMDKMLDCNGLVSLAVTSTRIAEAVTMPPCSSTTEIKTVELPYETVNPPSRKFLRNSGKILGPHDRIPLPPGFTADANRAAYPPLRPQKQRSESIQPTDQLFQSPSSFKGTADRVVPLACEGTFPLFQRSEQKPERMLETHKPVPPLSASSAAPSRAISGSRQAEATLLRRRAVSLRSFTTDGKTRSSQSFLDDKRSTSGMPRNDDQASIENQVSYERGEDLGGGRTENFPRSLSIASTIAAFPIPPMENQVGELSMTISHVTSPREFAETSNSISEAYHIITKAHITELLERTRSRGAHLQTVEWNNLTTFEKTWREVNEQFLVTIYGRRDVSLTEADVEYIDAIARRVREGEGSSSSGEWLRRVFCHDV